LHEENLTVSFQDINRHFAQTWYVLRKQLLLRKLIYMKTHQARIALALPDSKPWGITRFFNGVNDYASSRKWLLTACPVNPESSDDFPLGLSRLKYCRSDHFSFSDGARSTVTASDFSSIFIGSFPFFAPSSAETDSNCKTPSRLKFVRHFQMITR
jgi:hypothetical protein